MISMILKDEDDAKALYDRFTQAGELVSFYIKGSDHHVRIECGSRASIISRVSSILTEHVIATREEALLLARIAEDFYFKDWEEQEQILTIAKSILEGEKPDLPGLDEMKPRRQQIWDAFYGFIRDGKVFDYESFIFFRLKGYKKCLKRYVEMAVDEYKLEQDYQSFVESMRGALEQRRSLLETVHLVFRRQFELYDERYRRVDERTVNKQLDGSLRSRCSLNMEPSVLITLIGIAPKTLFLYTDDVDAGMIQTIQNVFQERVVICPARACDFRA